MKYYRWVLMANDGCKGKDEDQALRDALAQIEVNDLSSLIVLEEITEDEYADTGTGMQDPDLG